MVDVFPDYSLNKVSSSEITPTPQTHSFPPEHAGWFAFDCRKDANRLGDYRRVYLSSWMPVPSQYDMARVVDFAWKGAYALSLDISLVPSSVEWHIVPYETNNGVNIWYDVSDIESAPFESFVTVLVSRNPPKKVPLSVERTATYMNTYWNKYKQLWPSALGSLYLPKVAWYSREYFGPDDGLTWPYSCVANWLAFWLLYFNEEPANWICVLHPDIVILTAPAPEGTVDEMYARLQWVCAHELLHYINFELRTGDAECNDPKYYSEGIAQWGANAICHELYFDLYETNMGLPSAVNLTPLPNCPQGYICYGGILDEWQDSSITKAIPGYYGSYLYYKYLAEQTNETWAMQTIFEQPYLVYGKDKMLNIMQYNNGIDEAVFQKWVVANYAKDLANSASEFTYKEYVAGDPFYPVPYNTLTPREIRNCVTIDNGEYPPHVSMTAETPNLRQYSSSRFLFDPYPSVPDYYYDGVPVLVSAGDAEFAAFAIDRSPKPSMVSSVYYSTDHTWNRIIPDFSFVQDRLIVIPFVLNGPEGVKSIQVLTRPNEVGSTCPVDLVLRLPDGRVLTKDSSYFAGGSYVEFTDSIGEIHDRIYWALDSLGCYHLAVVLDSTASPTDSFSIYLKLGNDTLWLARDVKIADIPAKGYSFNTLSYASLNGFVMESSGNGLLGVNLDVYDSSGNLWRSLVTDDSGYYHIDSIPNGNYSISVVTPLGYQADQETKEFTIHHVPVRVDFSLTKLAITPRQRSCAYWAEQLCKALQNKPKDYTRANFSRFAGLINVHFNQNEINPVNFYTVPQPANQSDSLMVMKKILTMCNNENEPLLKRLAKAQLMTLMLNVVSGKIHQTQTISADNRTLSQAITFCDQLIGGEITCPDNIPGHNNPHCPYILSELILNLINVGATVPSNLIPADVIQIAYDIHIPESAPEHFALNQNYPNPFNPECEISYALPTDCHVTLTIYNVLGQRVKVLVDEYQNSGNKTVSWDSKDDQGQEVTSGIYFYRIKAGDFVQSKKMVLMK